MFQTFNLLPTLTASENVSLPLSLDGVSEANAKIRAQSALQDVALVDRAEYYPSQLSGGEILDLTEDIPPNYDFFSEGPGYDALD